MHCGILCTPFSVELWRIKVISLKLVHENTGSYGSLYSADYCYISGRESGRDDNRPETQYFNFPNYDYYGTGWNSILNRDLSVTSTGPNLGLGLDSSRVSSNATVDPMTQFNTLPILDGLDYLYFSKS